MFRRKFGLKYLSNKILSYFVFHVLNELNLLPGKYYDWGNIKIYIHSSHEQDSNLPLIFQIFIHFSGILFYSIKIIDQR